MAVLSRSDVATMQQPTPCEQGGDGRPGANPCSKRRFCEGLSLLCRPMYRYYNHGPKEEYPPERVRIPTRALWEQAETDVEAK